MSQVSGRCGWFVHGLKSRQLAFWSWDGSGEWSVFWGTVVSGV